MNKMGALLFVALALPSPLAAQSVSGRVASKEDARVQNDVTGAIGKDNVGLVSPGADAAKGSSPQGTATLSYEEAFRNWRTCVTANQSIANPPPQCDPLRAALRETMAARPRGYPADGRPRS